MSENGVIGKDNQLPWHLPNDLKHFKALTMGKTIIMGRKTFESIGKVLPGRKNIIISSDTNYTVPDGTVIHNINELIAQDKHDSESEKMIIGGATLYNYFLDKANIIYLTKVHSVIEGDTFFPELSNEWEIAGVEHFEVDPKHEFAYSFITLKKVKL